MMPTITYETLIHRVKPLLLFWGSLCRGADECAHHVVTGAIVVVASRRVLDHDQWMGRIMVLVHVVFQTHQNLR